MGLLRTDYFGVRSNAFFARIGQDTRQAVLDAVEPAPGSAEGVQAARFLRLPSHEVRQHAGAFEFRALDVPRIFALDQACRKYLGHH